MFLIANRQKVEGSVRSPVGSRRLGVIGGFVLVALLCGCDDDEKGRPPAPPVPGSHAFEVHVDPDGAEGPVVTVTHSAEPQRVLWETVPAGGFAGAAVAHATDTDNRGSFKIEDSVQVSCDRQTVEDVIGSGDAVTLSGRFEGEGCDVGYTMRFERVSDNQLGFDLSLRPLRRLQPCLDPLRLLG